MSQIYVTKIVIETQSPMAINTGSRETGFDSQLARDASGLPYIPATSIAGVWSHLANEALGEDLQEKWFGSTCQSSSLVISNGIIHSSKNIPVSPLMNKENIENDELLNFLSLERPYHRERVSINDRGVAKQTGKFDQLLLPKGNRFSLTFKWTTRERNDGLQLLDSEWKSLLALWNDRTFALGSSTRNGLGMVKVLKCEQHCFDLSEGPHIGQELQRFIDKKCIDSQDLRKSKIKKAVLVASLPLKAVDNWRCGSGSTLLTPKDKLPDGSVSILTYSEPQVEWNRDQQGSLSRVNKPILCGSTVKGIIAHRIAFHIRRHTQLWAEDMADLTHDEWQKSPGELQELFGFASDNDLDGRAGSVYIDDTDIIFEKTVIRHHNKIDRFTGGVQKGSLFIEELLYQPKFTLKIWIDRDIRVSPVVKQAFEDTINDLEIGLLPMGAGSGRGSSLVLPQNNKEWLFKPDLIQVKTLTKGADK